MIYIATIKTLRLVDTCPDESADARNCRLLLNVHHPEPIRAGGGSCFATDRWCAVILVKSRFFVSGFFETPVSPPTGVEPRLTKDP